MGEDNKNRCIRCCIKIDKSACGELFSIITFVDDLSNIKTQRKRVYLCESCSVELNGFMGYPISFQESKIND